MPVKKKAPKTKKKSNFGWKVGDTVGYAYRSAKNPKGKVTAVHPGTTKKNATVSIRPDASHNFGEGVITRHMDKIHHATLTPSDKKPISKKKKK